MIRIRTIAMLGFLAVLAVPRLAVAASSGPVLERWMVADRGLHPAGLRLQDEQWLQVDLSGLTADVIIHSARLLLRREPWDGSSEDALINVEIYAGDDLAGPPLELVPPWYDALEATAVVRRWLRQPDANRRFFVKACPRWRPAETSLEIGYEGVPRRLPPPVGGLKVLHRAGQTFVVWEETASPPVPEPIRSGELRRRLAEAEESGAVRYRVYRHRGPIRAATIAQAEFLGTVRPFSGYNLRGRSVDEWIQHVRRQAIEDDDLAKRLARNNYFAAYHPDMPEMDALPVERFAIEDGRPLPPQTGLFVHHPTRAGEAFYAVVSEVDGVANLRDFSAGNSLSTPVTETVGPGEPVRQGSPEVTVFFDYPGTRHRYVQWASPPRAHLPGMSFNWGVFVPRGWENAPAKRLSVFFHDATQRYLKPPWLHRPDTVLLSPHDAPYRGYGYGHHEALGTLRSFRQGQVQPFLARRVDVLIDWAVQAFGADPARISCGGHGPWGGTAALQYGLRRPGRIAYVMADQSPDPNPRQTPLEYKHYGRDNEAPSRTHRAAMESIWGRPDWNIPGESGRPVWEELDLPAWIRADPARPRPFLSLGAGSMHVTWAQQTELMKACLETGQAFMAEFFWGSSDCLPLPAGAFEPRTDQPLLACKPKAPHAPEFIRTKFETGERGYGSGSRLNTVPRWSSEQIVDEPGRLELTLYAEGSVTYSGSAVKEVTIRNTQQFRPHPAERVVWSLRDLKTGTRTVGGEIQVDALGCLTIPELRFGPPARLILERAVP